MKIAVLSTAHVHFDLFTQAVLLNPTIDFVGIYDEDQDRAKPKAEAYQTTLFSSIADAIQVSDAVIVCSENTKHEEMVLAALEANRHVLCEKPLSTSTKSAVSMAMKADQKGLVLATAFPMRFNRPALEMKKAIEAQKIGEILAFHGTNQGQCPGGWFVDKQLSGGGAVMDHTVHLLDMMRWLTGAEVSRVYAEVDAFLHSQYGIDDVGHVQLEFDNDVIADIDPSWSRPLGYPTWGGLALRVTGKEGTLDLDGFSQIIQAYSNQGTTWEGWGDFEYKYMIEGFMNRIKGRHSELASAWDGVAAVKVVEAAYQSAQEGEVVSVK